MKRMRLSAAMPLDTKGAHEPKWNLVFPRGEWHGANLQPIGGSITLGDEVFTEMVRNWASAGRPQLPITFHHVDDFRDCGVPPEELKKAAGWYTDFRITEAGLEGLTSWTPNARSRIEAGEYAFVSPEWTNRGTDRRTGASIGWWLYGAALLNDPFFHTQPRVAAAVAAAVLPTHPPTTEGVEPKENTMDKKMICKWLGVPEDTEDEKVMAALAEKFKASAGTEEKLTAAMKGVEATTAEVVKLNATVAALEAEKAKALASLAERDFEDVFKAGLAEGRGGLPVMKETLQKLAASVGLDAVKTLVAALPKVALTEAGVSTPAPEASGDFVAMKAAYEAKLDELIKGGLKTHEASSRLRKDPSFAAFFKASASTLTTARS